MLEQWTDPMSGSQIVRLALTDNEMREMDREQLDMIADAVFLIEHALKGKVDGPLTLPRTGLPIR